MVCDTTRHVPNGNIVKESLSERGHNSLVTSHVITNMIDTQNMIT